MNPHRVEASGICQVARLLVPLMLAGLLGCPGGGQPDAAVGDLAPKLDLGGTPDLGGTSDGVPAPDDQQPGPPNGSLSPPVVIDPGLVVGAQIAIGDMDGDGKPDVVIAWSTRTLTNPQGEEGLSISFNHGGRKFDPPIRYSTIGVDQVSIALGDFNGDHLLDVAWLRSQDGHYLINRGKRAFAPVAAIPYPDLMYCTNISGSAAGDFNHDGFDDLVFGGYSALGPGPGPCPPPNPRAFVDLGDGAGGLRMPVAYSADFLEFLTVADLDQDGWVDAVDSTQWGRVEILFNDHGVLTAPNDSYGYFAFPPSVADMDGDGLPDLVYSCGGTEERQVDGVCINKNLGHRTFAPAQTFDATCQNGIVADMNHDGRPDFVCPRLNSLFVMRNQGGGQLGAPEELVHQIDVWKIAVGDLDGDGKTDLVVSTVTEVLVYFNDTP